MRRFASCVLGGPRLLILVVTVALAFLVGCYTTMFTPASQPRQYTGDGGTAHQVDGVEIWTFGAPERPFEIIGWLEDKRHTGLISRQTFDPDVAEAAKKAGGDGVIVQHSDTQFRGYVVGSNYATAVNDRTTHLVVFKYIKKPGIPREALKARPTPMKNGFRDLTWGQPPPEGFRPLSADVAPMALFERPGESMKVGPAEAQMIEYGFLDGKRLVHVQLYFPLSAEAGLKSLLEEMYGPPEQVRSPSEESWTRSDENTVVTLKVEADRVSLFLGSHEMIDEALRRLKEAKAKDAGL